MEPIFYDASILSGVWTTVSLGIALTEIGHVASIRLGRIFQPPVEKPDLEKIRQEIREKDRKKLPKKKINRPARRPKVFLLRFLSHSFLFCLVIFLRFRYPALALAFQSLYGGQFTLSTLLINQIFV